MQNPLVRSIQGVTLLIAGSLGAERNEGALGSNLDRFPGVELTENHDVIGAFHHVTNLVGTFRQQGACDQNLLGEIHLVAVFDTHRVVGGGNGAQYEETQQDETPSNDVTHINPPQN